MKKVLALVAWFGRRAQPAPLAPGNSFAGLNETEFKASIAAAIRAAYDEGAAAERSRIEAILTGARARRLFPDIAADLVLGPATGEQAAGVLARAEADAAKRAALLKSSPLESATHVPTLH